MYDVSVRTITVGRFTITSGIMWSADYTNPNSSAFNQLKNNVSIWVSFAYIVYINDIFFMKISVRCFFFY